MPGLVSDPGKGCLRLGLYSYWSASGLDALLGKNVPHRTLGQNTGRDQALGYTLQFGQVLGIHDALGFVAQPLIDQVLQVHASIHLANCAHRTGVRIKII